MTEPLIYFAETGDRVAFVNFVLDKFRPAFAGKKVFVKPNVVSHEHYPTTTHPDVLGAVLDYLQGCGCEIAAGDGPAFDAGDARKIISNHPLTPVCEKRGIELLNLHSYRFHEVKTASMSMGISDLAAGSYIISLPVLKAHIVSRMTGALKNQFGFLRNRDRFLMHTGVKNLDRGIAETDMAVKAGLFIIDAVETLDKANECRHGGCKAGLGYMLAGDDPVALDCFGLELLQKTVTALRGKTPEDIPYIKHAFELGLGSMKYRAEKIDL